VQRLYSSFPTGSTGISLVVLRCVVAITVFAHVTGCWITGAALAVKGMVLLVGLCLCLGFLTPYGSALSSVLEVALLISGSAAGRFQFGMAALTAVALVGLGPGAYSVDARLFGRRVITIPAGRDPH
jgi:uncharacterized membrane protein YphA (DoxX/SURF4 family)